MTDENLAEQPTADVAGLVERLRTIYEDDHERGCNGRFYECTCGFDDATWTSAHQAADALTTLSRRNAELEAENARKDDMLRLAARWFEQYAIDHEVKAGQAVDSYEQANRMDKARRNTERANEIRATLKGSTDAR